MPTPWLPLTDAAQLPAIAEESRVRPVLIFKHSTTCSISAAAKSKLERQWDAAGLPADMSLYYLDLLRYRPLSVAVAEQFGVQHESPQLLLIQDGACRYDASHMGIRLADVVAVVSG